MIAVTADIHAHNYKPYSTVLENGRNSRLDYIVQAMRWMADDAKERGCKYFVIIGDLFHSRRSIEVPVLSAISETIAYISKKFKKLVLIVGNHDSALTGESAISIGAFRRRNVKVVTKPTIVDCGHRVGCIPWTLSRHVFKQAVRKLKKEGCDGIMAHVAIDESWAGPSDYEVPGEVKARDVTGKHLWALLGHFHKTQTWESLDHFIAYVGSLLQHTSSERGEKKGYWIVPKKASKLPFFVENEISPRFVVASTKGELKVVRKIDYVKLIGENAEALGRSSRMRGSNPIVVPAKHDIGEVRLPPQTAGDAEIVKAFVTANGVPDSLTAQDVIDIGIKILRSES